MLVMHIASITTIVSRLIEICKVLIKKCMQLVIICMHMYRRPSRRTEIIKRIAVYSAMTALVLIIVTALILITMGYRLDTDNGRVEQGALLQFATVPSGATIEIDGKVISSKTPTKSSVLAGQHEFVMWRDGYETWRKGLDVKAGTLTWLNYARLVPKARPVVAVSLYPTLKASLATLDGQTMLLQPDGSQPSFQLADLRSDNVKTTSLTLPDTAYSDAKTSGVIHDFRIDQWDSSGRYVLIQHSYADKKEWLVLDTQDVAATKNVTKLLDLDIVSPKFSGTNGSTLFALSGSDVRKLDLSAGTISRSLVTNVTSFDLFNNNIITYLGTDAANPAKRVVGVYRDGDGSPHVLRSFDSPTTVPLAIATSHYFNQDYVAIAEGNKVDILSGNYPNSGSSDISSLGKFGSFNFLTGVDRLLFSPTGNYLLVQSGTNFASFDIEHQKVAVSAVSTTAITPLATLAWLDNNYVWSDFGGRASLREFDGANSYDINPVATGQSVTLSQNGRYLYSVGKTNSGLQLQRVRMILP